MKTDKQFYPSSHEAAKFDVIELFEAIDFVQKELQLPIFPIKHDSKHPAVKWQTYDIPTEKLEAWFDPDVTQTPYEAYGIVLPDNLIVIDVDAKNEKQGHQSQIKLEEKLNISLDDSCSLIISSGSAGFSKHYFFTLPEKHQRLFHGKLSSLGFPDIDIKKKGGYVIGAGSNYAKTKADETTNFDGNAYSFIKKGMPSPIPIDLLELITKESPIHKWEQNYSKSLNIASVSSVLSHYLSFISADLDYDDWVSIGMALHYETNGSQQGYDLFDSWSSEGTNYGGADDTIAKWKSFQNAPETPVKLGTIIHHARKNENFQKLLAKDEVQSDGLSNYVSSELLNGQVPCSKTNFIDLHFPDMADDYEEDGEGVIRSSYQLHTENSKTFEGQECTSPYFKYPLRFEGLWLVCTKHNLKFRFSNRGLLYGCDTLPNPAPEKLYNRTEAQGLISRHLNDAINKEPFDATTGNFLFNKIKVLKITQGTGKTKQTIDVAKNIPHTEVLMIAEPTIEKVNEVVNDFSNQGVSARPSYSPTLGNRLCIKMENSKIEATFSSSLCMSCPFMDECEYQKRKSIDSNIIVTTHAALFGGSDSLRDAEGSKSSVDHLIIDESPLASVVGDFTINKNSIDQLKDIIDGNNSGFVFAINKLYEIFTEESAKQETTSMAASIKAVEKIAKDRKLYQSLNSGLGLLARQKDIKIAITGDEITPEWIEGQSKKNALSEWYEALSLLMTYIKTQYQDGILSMQTTKLNNVPAIIQTKLDNQLVITQVNRELKGIDGSPRNIIALDATANETVYQQMLPYQCLEMVNIDVERNLRTIQQGSQKIGKKEREKTENLKLAVAAMNSGCVIISPKPLNGTLRGVHYGSVSGKNEYTTLDGENKTFDETTHFYQYAMFVYHSDALAAIASGLWADKLGYEGEVTEQDHQLNFETVNVAIPYCMKDGNQEGIGAMRYCHLDRRLHNVDLAKTDSENIQADRSRSVWSDEKKTMYIDTSQPIFGRMIDEALTRKDFQKLVQKELGIDLGTKGAVEIKLDASIQTTLDCLFKGYEIKGTRRGIQTALPSMSDRQADKVKALLSDSDKPESPFYGKVRCQTKGKGKKTVYYSLAV